MIDGHQVISSLTPIAEMIEKIEYFAGFARNPSQNGIK